MLLKNKNIFATTALTRQLGLSAFPHSKYYYTLNIKPTFV
jgi:hypothetical protein